MMLNINIIILQTTTACDAPMAVEEFKITDYWTIIFLLLVLNDNDIPLLCSSLHALR
jgi:hypothetical protein